MDIFANLWTAFPEKIGGILATFVVSCLAVIAWGCVRYLFNLSNRFLHFVRSRRRALDAVRQRNTGNGLREGRGVWLTDPIEQPTDYKRRIVASKVLAVANLKGGVGKTTLAANIGAILAKDFGLRVLLIDLDFQGSLSSMAFPRGDWVPLNGQDSLATQLISGNISPQLVPNVARDVPIESDDNRRGRLAVVPCFYDLAQADNRLMVEWLLNFRSRRPNKLRAKLLDWFGLGRFRLQDVRYTLAEILQSEVVSGAFDLVVIDCPPRLTTSAVQAFCASSHLLVPTIFDRTSAEAVVSFHQQIETLKSSNICPAIKYLGVVGTKWRHDQIVPVQWRNEIEMLLEDTELKVLPEDTFLIHATALVNNADEGIAYLTIAEVKRNAAVVDPMKRLASYVARQMGIPIAQPARLQAAE